MTEAAALRDSNRPIISAAIRAKLVDTVYDQHATIVAGSVNTICLGLFCFARSGERWLLVWVAFSIVTLAGRLYLAGEYRARDRRDDPNIWATRFTIGAFMTSLGWAFASAISIFYSDAFEQMVILSGESAYVAAAAVRNNGVVKAAMLQTAPLAITIAALLATGNSYYMIFSIFICVYLAGMIEIVRFSYNKTLDLLVAKDQAAVAFEELMLASKQLEYLAATDGLTGALNRRAFDLAFEAECHRASGTKEALSLIIVDIDHFKGLNDAFGHQAGDACLRKLAACLKLRSRPSDLLARYGGEEFAIVLPQTPYRAAGLLAEAIRRAVEELAVCHEAAQLGRITVSVGFTTANSGSMVDGVAMIKQADDALYRAKAMGRNRVEGSSMGDSPKGKLRVPLDESEVWNAIRPASQSVSF